MTVVVELPEEIADLAEKEARRQSLDLPGYVLGVVKDAIRHSDEANRISRSLALLDSLDGIGGDVEQRATFEYLKKAVDEDRMSTRRLFS